jgi:hypothetical protein
MDGTVHPVLSLHRSLSGEDGMRVRSSVLAFAVLLGLPAVGQSQGGSFQVGPRVTHNFDFEETAIGFHATFPFASRLEFYPSLDIFLVEGGSLLGINGDLKFRPSAEMPVLYVGTGLNLTRGSGGGTSNTEAGLNIFGGLEAQTGAIRPFVELRAIVGDGTSAALAGGLNITLRNR